MILIISWEKWGAGSLLSFQNCELQYPSFSARVGNFFFFLIVKKENALKLEINNSFKAMPV